MSAFLKTGLHQRLDLLLSVVMTFEVFVYFAAALLHLGIRMRVGSLVLAVPDAILPASIVETILGLAVASNLAVLIASKRQSIRITTVVHLFALVGVLLGMVALAIRVGPPPSPHWNLHYVMLVCIAIVMVLILLRRKSKTE